MGTAARIRRFYGARPLHLLTLLASAAFVGYVLSVVGVGHLWNHHTWWKSIAVWFLGAVVLHDLVLFPLYALAHRTLHGAWTAAVGRHPAPELLVSPVNYVRLPVMASGLLFLLFFPGIVEQGRGTYEGATGLTQAPFLGRWLLLCGAFFSVSAVLYALRTVTVRRRSAADPHPVPADDGAATAVDGAG